MHAMYAIKEGGLTGKESCSQDLHSSDALTQTLVNHKHSI